MSMNYKGGIISATPPTTSSSSASGVWTLQQQMQAIAAGNWPLYIPSDPYFNQTALLLHGNGTNGAQNNTFLDSSTNNFTITRNGNTTQGTFSPYGSNWGNYFDGAGDYLSLADNAAFTVGTGDLTIEAWVYVTSLTQTYQGIISGRVENGGTGYPGLGLVIDASKIAFTIYNYLNALTDTVNVPTNQWVHVVGVRSGTNAALFVNGVRKASATNSENGTSNAMRIGRFYTLTDNYYLNGYISNARLVKGTAVYDPTQTTLTVPTAPLTAITNTSLLTCQSNRFIDNSTNNFAITRNGDVSVQRFSPFAPSAAYSASTIGGSGYFDGSGDCLTVASNAAFGYGTGNFTFEAWINPSVVQSSYVLDHGTTGNIGTIELGGSGQIIYYRPSAAIQTTTGLVPAGSWTHVAVVRSSGTTTIYINGVSQASGADSYNYPDQRVVIGAISSNFLYAFSGYISNLRIVKGTAVYTTNFTPSTAPLTAITNTSLLLNYTNAGILDNAMMNDLETVGNAQISTAQSKFGGGSMYFDGTGDYLVTPSSPSNTLDSGDFTVEFWAYPSNTSSAYRALVSSENYDAVSGGWSIYQNGTSIEVWLSSGQLINATSALTASTWQHVALSRSSGTVRLFVNGTSISSASNSASWTGQRIWIGDNNRAGPDYFYDGYIDDLRITKGIARYTANFTPPTAEFQNL